MINSDLRARCEAIAKLEIQRKELADEVKRLKEKAKSDGFDTKLITKTVALLMKPAARQKQELEQHSLFDSYLMAVGLLPDDEESSRDDAAEKPAADADHDPITGEIQETETRPVPAAPQPELDGAAEGEGAVNLTPSAAPIPIPPVDPPSSQGMADEAAEGADSQLGPSAADTSDDLALPAFLNLVNWRAA